MSRKLRCISSSKVVAETCISYSYLDNGQLKTVYKNFQTQTKGWLVATIAVSTNKVDANSININGLSKDKFTATQDKIVVVLSAGDVSSELAVLTNALEPIHRLKLNGFNASSSFIYVLDGRSGKVFVQVQQNDCFAVFDIFEEPSAMHQIAYQEHVKNVQSFEFSLPSWGVDLDNTWKDVAQTSIALLHPSVLVVTAIGKCSAAPNTEIVTVVCIDTEEPKHTHGMGTAGSNQAWVNICAQKRAEVKAGIIPIHLFAKSFDATDNSSKLLACNVSIIVIPQ